MKTALIFFKEQNKIFKAEYYSAIAGWFENAGVDIHALDVLSSNDGSAFKRRLAEYKNTVDNLIVFENFIQKHLTKLNGKLIDKSADT